MSTQGFVYTGTITESGLRSLLAKLSGKVVHFVWDLANLQPGKGVPGELKDNGTVFNEHCEIRWQRIGKDAFRVWVLTDEPMDTGLLHQVEGEWSIEDQTTQLVSLKAPQFCPSFQRYPVVESEKARLRCRIFCRDGVAIFISPREVLPDEEQAV